MLSVSEREIPVLQRDISIREMLSVSEREIPVLQRDISIRERYFCIRERCLN